MAITIETERKFLLKKLPNIVYDDSIEITQYYLKINNIWERYRKSVHLDGEVRYYKTIKKSLEIGSSEEDEIELSSVDYNKSVSLCSRFESKVLNKTRYIFYLGDNLKWEVDDIIEKNIVIAEIEIPKLDFKFETPEWLESEIIKEVTDDYNYSSSSLANEL